MRPATLHIDAKNPLSPIDPRLYSSFVEHMGRAVYTGVYEPGHKTADAYGFRQDVADLIRPLNLSCIRYPGGNFVSGYRWEDGVGPREQRPVRPELAWFALEPNEVGTDEFLAYCERLGTRAMMAVNLGTGTPQSAGDLLEYCNAALPTHYANLRRQNGREQPYGVKLWCLGNEMDGPWQIGGKTAMEYARTACETAKIMKWLDPSIELVACGSSYHSMPTFGAWERTVLTECYPHIDYLSLHQYYTCDDGKLPDFLARSLDMDAFIREVAGICREVKAALGQTRDVGLSFDEWNVWYHYKLSGKQAETWIVGRPIEEEDYNLADALLVGAMLNTLINNADTVKIACLAQLVNVLAPIMTEPDGRAWAQTTYYPFLYASRYGRGTALRVEADAPAYACSLSERVPYLDCACVLSEAGDALTLFLVNRSEREALPLAASLSGFRAEAVCEAVTLTGDSPALVNTADVSPVLPKPLPGVSLREDALHATLPPLSWSMLRLKLEQAQR